MRPASEAQPVSPREAKRLLEELFDTDSEPPIDRTPSVAPIHLPDRDSNSVVQAPALARLI